MGRNGSWYNGYSPAERRAKLQALKRLAAIGEVPPPSGPCHLCSDAGVVVEYHSEDYAAPFLWTPPAAYVLCQHCHRQKLHKRFAKPDLWAAFLAHVRRGGYASDLKKPEVKREVERAQAAIRKGEKPSLASLRPYSRVAGGEWFGALTLDPRSLENQENRPR